MKSFDSVTSFNGGMIQHGPNNDRIYLMNSPENVSYDFIDSIISLAAKNRYSKIFAKVKLNSYMKFKDKGFIKEALIPGFYKGKEAVLFMSLYLTKTRSVDNKNEEYENILKICSSKNRVETAEMEHGCEIIRCSENDLEEMADLYSRVFSSYPFPIFETDYLNKTMNDNVDYFAVRKGRRLVSLSSAEKDMKYNNAEMTDFATEIESRGKGFSQILLSAMEREMEKQGIKTAYTIARSVSHGMNISFSRLGYEYNGRLINNTQISGQLESMNVWSKLLN